MSVELVGERDSGGITPAAAASIGMAAMTLVATPTDVPVGIADDGGAATGVPPMGAGSELPGARLARLAQDAAAAPARLAAADDGTGLELLPAAAVAELVRVVDASLAEASKRAYRADWHRFTAWATENGYPCLPAPPAVLAGYVTAAAAEQRPNGAFAYAPATLTRWVSSINQAHTAAGLDPPGRSELVRRALAGIRRIRKAVPVRRAPLLLADVRGLVDWLSVVAGGWPAGVAARRDTALLLIGFAGAFRRAELAGLTVGDVMLHRTDGLHVRLRSSKTDQEALGRTVALPTGGTR